MKRLVPLLLLVAQTAVAGSQVVASKAALSTASQQATQVGLDILKRGGDAADAAVAVAFALAVVHPKAGNIGGGRFGNYFDPKTKGGLTPQFHPDAPGPFKA